MRMKLACALSLALLALGVLTAPPTSAQSSIQARWLTDPARAGQANTVVIVIDGQADAAGLTASIIHGDRASPLTLVDRAGQWQADYTPPAAGPYIVHVTGSVNGQAIDEQVTLADVQDATLGLPAIQVEAPEPVPNQTPTGPNWTLIGGSALAALLLIAAVLVGRIKR